MRTHVYSTRKNDDWQLSSKMSICAKNDIIILSFDKVVKNENQEKTKRNGHSWLFTVCTPSIAIDYINTDFDHRLN